MVLVGPCSIANILVPEIISITGYGALLPQTNFVLPSNVRHLLGAMRKVLTKKVLSRKVLRLENPKTVDIPLPNPT